MTLGALPQFGSDSTPSPFWLLYHFPKNSTFELYTLVGPLIRIIADFNADRVPDILTAGNNSGTAPKSGPIAGLGSLPIGNGDHGYEVYPADKTEFRASVKFEKWK